MWAARFVLGSVHVGERKEKNGSWHFSSICPVDSCIGSAPTCGGNSTLSLYPGSDSVFLGSRERSFFCGKSAFSLPNDLFRLIWSHRLLGLFFFNDNNSQSALFCFLGSSLYIWHFNLNLSP